MSASIGEEPGVDASAVEAEFERRRLAFLASQGFEGRGSRVAGRLGDTYVITGGDGASRRLLIHGGLSEGSEWGLLAGRLDGRIAIADRPGCGLSYRIDYGRIDDFRGAASEWVDEVVNGLGEEQVDLIANSMGAYFAMAFATDHPDRVRRLVLLGAPAGLVRQLPLFLRLWGNPVTGQVIRRLRTKDPEQLRDRAMGALVAHPERLPDDYLEVAFLAGRLPGSEVTSYTMLRSVADLRGWRTRLLIEEAMATLEVPTLFAWGERDAFLPASIGRSLAERMPAARFESISHAGHVAQLDEPGPIAQLVNGFLAE